jgi:hypothetical protein
MILLSQEPKTIKVKKTNDPQTDSVFYDFEKRALYSKTSGYDNRFKTLKQCTLSYSTKRKSGTLVMKKSKLPSEVKDILSSKSKEIVLKFTDIVLLADSLNPNERKCPNLTITRTKKLGFFRIAIGGWFGIPTPFPSWRTLGTKVEWGD